MAIAILAALAIREVFTALWSSSTLCLPPRCWRVFRSAGGEE